MVDLPRRMRRFVLWRKEDQTGVSGTGIVAQGIQFGDGRVSLRWLSDHASTANFDSIDDVRAIHGHDGATVVDWMDAGWSDYNDEDKEKAFQQGIAEVDAQFRHELATEQRDD